jgi:hypothetical protein
MRTPSQLKAKADAFQASAEKRWENAKAAAAAAAGAAEKLLKAGASGRQLVCQHGSRGGSVGCHAADALQKYDASSSGGLTFEEMKAYLSDLRVLCPSCFHGLYPKVECKDCVAFSPTDNDVRWVIQMATNEEWVWDMSESAWKKGKREVDLKGQFSLFGSVTNELHDLFFRATQSYLLYVQHHDSFESIFDKYDTSKSVFVPFPLVAWLVLAAMHHLTPLRLPHSVCYAPSVRACSAKRSSRRRLRI